MTCRRSYRDISSGIHRGHSGECGGPRGDWTGPAHRRRRPRGGGRGTARELRPGAADPGGVQPAHRGRVRGDHAEPAQRAHPRPSPGRAPARPPVPVPGPSGSGPGTSTGRAVPVHGLGLFPAVIAAFATWLLLVGLHLSLFPAAGQAGHLPAGLRRGPRGVPADLALGPGRRRRGLRSLVGRATAGRRRTARSRVLADRGGCSAAVCAHLFARRRPVVVPPPVRVLPPLT